jgi:hypothetical protein
MKFYNLNKLKEYIFSKITEIDIFSYYLNISNSDIINSINNSSKIKNHFRVEKNPSIEFKYSNSGKLRMIDYGSRIWCGDCFHIAGLILNKNSNDNKDFIYILKDIINNVICDKTEYSISITNDNIKQQQNDFTKIDILTQDFTQFDYNYFKQYHIRQESIKNIFVVKQYWINNKLNLYNYNQNDPCFAYFLDKYHDKIIWELYFPLRKNGMKFLTNNSIPIKSITQLKPNKYLIITKSKKDKILLEQIFNDLDIIDVSIAQIHSESVNMTQDIIDYLKKLYKVILTIFDNDDCGKEQTNYFAAKFLIYPFPFQGGLDMKLSKDISDTSKDYGYNYILNIVRLSYIKLINNETM